MSVEMPYTLYRRLLMRELAVNIAMRPEDIATSVRLMVMERMPDMRRALQERIAKEASDA